MVLIASNADMEEAMPQTVPSAGFTPPCDYSNFADTFDLSLLPGGDPVSPSTQFYTQSPPPPSAYPAKQPKIYTTFYSNSPTTENNIDLGPDFQQLLVPNNIKQKTKLPSTSPISNIFLEVPNNQNYPNSPVSTLSPYSPQSLLSPNDQFNSYRQSSDANFYPSSPELSLYTPSPNSVYSRSPCEEYLQNGYIKKEQPSTSPLPSFSPFQIKEENFLSPCGFSSPNSPAASYSSLSSPEQINLQQTTTDTASDVFDLLEKTPLEKQIKQESTVDFGNILQSFQDSSDTLQQLLEQDIKNSESQIVPEKPKDHQLLREVLRDTSFQKKYNIRPFDLNFISCGDIKMEEPDKSVEGELIRTCNEQLAGENMEPVLNLAIEHMRKDFGSTCAALGISPDPSKWDPGNVLSWLRWMSRQFKLPEPNAEQWDMTGSSLMALTEQEFVQRMPQGEILFAQLEIWKAAHSEEDLSMQWLPETTSSNASSGDVSEDEDEESNSPTVDAAKPSSSRSTGGSHIHLWQFLKELLASPQTHGSCIRWLDRSKGIFKIEDSVRVARLWGKRKNRPAMNYDKLSRSIRQYYKKGIMKKTERSQRLVYQFCHPYNL